MISTIIPVYNRERYIKNAIESILNQTYKGPLEVIVVDDGSTDNTASIVESFANVKYVYKENGGESSARNFGLSLAKGDYISWLDSDDWLEPTCFDEQLSYLQHHPNVDFVYCDFRVYDEAINEYYIQNAESYIENPRDFLATILYRQIIPNSACMMLRKKCIQGFDLYDENAKSACDYKATINLLSRGFLPGYLPKPLYGYRRHLENISNQYIKTRSCEASQVSALGLPFIKKAVNETSYDQKYKDELLAKIHMKIHRSHDAIDLLLPLAKSGSLHAQFLLANSYFQSNQYQKAESLYQELLKKKEDLPFRAELHNNLGCSLKKRNEVKKASLHFEKASLLRKGYVDPIRNLKAIENHKDEIFFTLFELRKHLQPYPC